jgi:hypothetical protein
LGPEDCTFHSSWEGTSNGIVDLKAVTARTLKKIAKAPHGPRRETQRNKQVTFALFSTGFVSFALHALGFCTLFDCVCKLRASRARLLHSFRLRLQALRSVRLAPCAIRVLGPLPADSQKDCGKRPARKALRASRSARFAFCDRYRRIVEKIAESDQREVRKNSAERKEITFAVFSTGFASFARSAFALFSTAFASFC